MPNLAPRRARRGHRPCEVPMGSVGKKKRNHHEVVKTLSKLCGGTDLGVSVGRGTPKWMVYEGESHLEMDDLGVAPF